MFAAAEAAAIALTAAGGAGGAGQAGQQGGQGGHGGDGARSEIWPVGTPSAATAGGNGGPGGKGADGGAPGAGGMPGPIMLRMVNLGAAAFTPALEAGEPGAPGQGGAGGAGGTGGIGGIPVVRQTITAGPGGGYTWIDGSPLPSGRTPAATSSGKTPNKLAKAAPGKPDIQEQCGPANLVAGLPDLLLDHVQMLIDRIQVDHLALTGSLDGNDYGALIDRVSWASTLLEDWTPLDLAGTRARDALRNTLKTVSDRLTAAIDYYGHSADWAPLGSIAFYNQRFANALDALTAVEKAHNAQAIAVATNNFDAAQSKEAIRALQDRLDGYQAGVTDKRRAIDDLIGQINVKDADLIDAKSALIDPAIDEFKKAVTNTCGLQFDDFVEVVSQIAFLGEKPLQQSAMVASQAVKLAETGLSKVVAADGTKFDKKLVIDKLTKVSFTKDALTGIVGDADGIRVTDRGAVRLLGAQAEFDQFCDGFWNISGAAAAKQVFDDYVAAVQARNADIVTLNETLSTLRSYIEGQAQTQQALDAVKAAGAARSDPGAATMVDQLGRMVVRTMADTVEALYLASRAYAFWSHEDGDELASVLQDFGAGQPLGMTSVALSAAGEQVFQHYSKTIEDQLSNLPVLIPPKNEQRGICIVLEQSAHPRLFAKLQRENTANFRINVPKPGTSKADNRLAAYPEFHLSQVCCWVHGARWAADSGFDVQINLTHEGRESFIGKDGKLRIFRHDPVKIIIVHDSRRPGDPDSISQRSDFSDDPKNPIRAPVGPYASWKIAINPQLNPGIDLAGVNQITLELMGLARSFGEMSP